MRSPHLGAVAILALLLAAPAFAQSTLSAFDLERVELNGGRGTLLVGDGQLLLPTGLTLGVLGHYQYLPLPLLDGDTLVRVVQHRATGVLFASYGVLPWLELDAQIPLVLWQQGEDPESLGLIPVAGQGLETPVLQARFGVLSQRLKHPVDLAADVGVGFPVGSGAALAGDHGPRFLVRVTVGGDLGFLHSSLDAGVLFRPSIPLETVEQQFLPGATPEIHLGAAVATLGKGLQGELDLRTILDPNVSKVSVELMAGGRLPLSTGLELSVLGGPGIVYMTGTPRFRVLAGLIYRAEPPPRLQYLDEAKNRNLRVSLAQPESTPEERAVQPTSGWELNAVSRNPQGGPGASSEPLRPFQPGPGEQVVLRGQVLFGRESRDLQGASPFLDQMVLQLREQPATSVVIEGHADEAEGTPTSNVTLSHQRAQAVQRYLSTQGITPGRVLQLRGLGSDNPVSAYPSTEEERRLNRRAEVLLLVQVPAPPAP